MAFNFLLRMCVYYVLLLITFQFTESHEHLKKPALLCFLDGSARFQYFYFVWEFVECAAGCIRDRFMWDEGTWRLLGDMERLPTQAGSSIFISHKFTFSI
jgi:hypothetical protein